MPLNSSAAINGSEVLGILREDDSFVADIFKTDRLLNIHRTQWDEVGECKLSQQNVSDWDRQT